MTYRTQVNQAKMQSEPPPPPPYPTLPPKYKKKQKKTKQKKNKQKPPNLYFNEFEIFMIVYSLITIPFESLHEHDLPASNP